MAKDKIRISLPETFFVRIIKLGIISIIVFSLVITGISLFFPSHVRISKAIDINTGKDSLLAQVSDLYNWKNWYPGADTMEIIRTSDNAPFLKLPHSDGHIRITDSNDSTIIAISDGEGIREMITGWNLYDAGIPHTITIQWYMDFHLRWYPWEKFSSLLLEKRYGPVMEKGLDKLKKLLENRLNGN